MTISIRKLQIFTAIARQGNVTRAAESLLLSQPALSMALADLERRHGGPLFTRRGRRLHLNDRGRLLLPLAEEILRRLAYFEQELDDSSPELSGQLRLGASTTIGNYLLPRLMARFSSRHPQAGIRLQVGNSEQMATALDAGDIDLALIEGPCHLPSLVQRPWRDDQLVVITGPEHRWAQAGAAIDRDELLQGEWIVREEGSGTRDVFERALGLPLAELPRVTELGHTEAIKKAVEAGLGVSCLSRLAVQRELDHGWLVAVPTPLVLVRPLTLLLPGGNHPSRLLQTCLEMLYAKSAPD